MRKKTALTHSKKRRSTRKSKQNRLYRRKTHKRSIKKIHSRKTGGDCGCGAKPIIGGSANLSQLDTKYYYPYNGRVVENPQNPTAYDMPVSGGKRTLREKTKRSGVFDQLSATKWRKVAPRRVKFSRRVKGGMNAFDNMYKQYSNSGSNMDSITSFGEINGVSKQADTITGMSSVSNSVTDQPVLTQPFGIYNPVLV